MVRFNRSNLGLFYTVVSILGVGAIGFVALVKLGWITIDKSKVNKTVGATMLVEKQQIKKTDETCKECAKKDETKKDDSKKNDDTKKDETQTPPTSPKSE